MKNLFFGLLVVGIAFAGSAFTNKTNGMGDHYGRNSAGNYVLISPTQWSPTNCETAPEEVICAFTQTTSETLAPTLTPAQVEVLKTANKLESVKTSLGAEIYGIYNLD